MSLHTRLALVMSAFTAAVIALFALFAMAFAFSVEDRFLERELARAAAPLREAHARSGDWPHPQQPGLQLVRRLDELPPEVARELAQEPERSEFAGDSGRHYHLMALQEGGPWLLAEVSEQLIVRPMRANLLKWLLGWGLVMVLLAALLGVWLARRFNAILAREQAFSHDASHELRTPLAVLRLGLERDGPEPLRAAVRQMEQTLSALLLLARESSLQPGRCAPLPLVEDWVLAHAALLDARRLRVDIAALPRDAQIALPELLLRPVLLSLLGNALAHADAGGCISVRVDAGQLVIANPGAGAANAEGLGLPLVRRLLARQAATLQLLQRDGRTEAWVQPRHTARDDKPRHPGAAGPP